MLFPDARELYDRVDRLLGQLEIEPVVVGDMHHQRAGLDAPEGRIDVVYFADPVAPYEIDGIVQLGAVGYAGAGLLIRGLSIEDLRLHRGKTLR